MERCYILYVVPLPKKREDKRRFLLKVFGSNVTMDILELTCTKERVAQKELIRKLPYSNKTIISYLNELVSLGILKESMERVRRDGRRIWIKQYTLTRVGRLIALLVSPPERLRREEIEKLLKDLLRLYLRFIVKLCLKHGLDAGGIQLLTHHGNVIIATCDII